jgi:hypothetical protein
MSSQKKKARKSRSDRRKRTTEARTVPRAIRRDLAVAVPVPEATMDVITEKTYVTTEPVVEIRRPATLAQALTQPAVAVVKPKSRVQKKVIARTRRAA